MLFNCNVKHLTISGGGSISFMFTWLILDVISNINEITISELILKMDSISSNSGGSWLVYSLLNGWIENNKYNEYVNRIKDDKEIQKKINVFKSLKISEIFLDDFSNNIEKIRSIQWHDFVDTYVNKISGKKTELMNIKWFKMATLSSSGIYGPKTYYDLNQKQFFQHNGILQNSKVDVEILNIQNSEITFYKSEKWHNQKFENNYLNKI